MDQWPKGKHKPMLLLKENWQNSFQDIGLDSDWRSYQSTTIKTNKNKKYLCSVKL